jgi:hypothetical protein
MDWIVSGYYSELMDIEDFDEQSEGEFEYNGDLTIEQLINRLNQMGFIAERGNLGQNFPIPV